MAKNKRSSGQPQKINGWQVLNNLLLGSLNKGQFPIAIIGIIAFLIIYKMPPSDVSKLAFDILAGFKDNSLIGYIFAGTTTFGWYFHARWQRRVFTSEIKRVSEERNNFQEKALPNKLLSSNR